MKVFCRHPLHTVSPCSAFCVEKNSMAPEVEVVGDEALRVPLLADSYVEVRA